MDNWQFIFAPDVVWRLCAAFAIFCWVAVTSVRLVRDGYRRARLRRELAAAEAAYPAAAVLTPRTLRSVGSEAKSYTPRLPRLRTDNAGVGSQPSSYSDDVRSRLIH